MEVLDAVLPETVRSLITSAFDVLTTLVMILYATPAFAFAVAPLAVVYIVVLVGGTIA